MNTNYFKQDSKPKIYLDNGATSYPKPEDVYLKMDSYLRNNGASPGRGNYAHAMEAERELYETRKKLGKLFNAPKSGQIVFTSNVTESINTVLKGFLKKGDKVLTSSIEHNAMWRPLKKMEYDGTIQLDTFQCQPDGTIDLDEVERKITTDTALVAIIHASNVIGNILPINEIIRLAHKKDVSVLVDCAQTAGILDIDVQQSEIDFLAFTGHKSLLGPTGTGGLYIREGLNLDTLIEGGTGSMSKSPFQPQNPPDRFEAGTLNMVGLVGLSAAVQYILTNGVDIIRKHELDLVEQLYKGLSVMDKVQLYGSAKVQEQVGLISFNIPDIDPYKVAFRLDDEYGIMVRAGLHCAPCAHEVIGTKNVGTVRISVSPFNTQHDISICLSAIEDICK